MIYRVQLPDVRDFWPPLWATSSCVKGPSIGCAKYVAFGRRVSADFAFVTVENGEGIAVVIEGGEVLRGTFSLDSAKVELDYAGLSATFCVRLSDKYITCTSARESISRSTALSSSGGKCLSKLSGAVVDCCGQTWAVVKGELWTVEDCSLREKHADVGSAYLIGRAEERLLLAETHAGGVVVHSLDPLSHIAHQYSFVEGTAILPAIGNSQVMFVMQRERVIAFPVKGRVFGFEELVLANAGIRFPLGRKRSGGGHLGEIAEPPSTVLPAGVPAVPPVRSFQNGPIVIDTRGAVRVHKDKGYVLLPFLVLRLW
jgi:hypothetical protein